MDKKQQEILELAQQAPVNAQRAAEVFRFLDLTNLNDEDGLDAVLSLCDQIESPVGHVAAVCIYPRFVKAVRQYLKISQVKIATVVNFPAGRSSIETVVAEIDQALHLGADEIDVVFPYHQFLANDEEMPEQFLRACRQACGQQVMKVILETGALQEEELIIDATLLAAEAGADFIKTSTGKINTGATLSAAYAILTTLKQFSDNTGHSIGFKAAGGIRNLQQAVAYLTLAEHIWQKENLSPVAIRFGASSLLLDIFHYL